jgi:hypothetical protein
MSKEHGNEKMPCQRSMSQKKEKSIAQTSQKLCDGRGRGIANGTKISYTLAHLGQSVCLASPWIQSLT